MTHASLFTGIGGFDLAARWMGWQNIFQVEIDAYCQLVLKKNFPDAHRYTDIRTFDARPYCGAIDVLSGGFPCQPYSLAGKRLGSTDDRALWPEMLRIIDECRPAYVVGENVGGFYSMEEPTSVVEMEDTESAFVWFEKVAARAIEDLNRIGYDVPRTDSGEPILFVIPACGVGAPHQRDRLWIVAHATDANLQRCEQLFATSEPDSEGFCSWGNNQKLACDSGCRHGKINGFRPKPQTQERGTNEHSHSNSGNPWQEHWLQVATRLCRVDDGFPAEMDGTGLLPSTSKTKKAAGKSHRLKALGNAIVPQVAYQIFHAIHHHPSPSPPALSQ